MSSILVIDDDPEARKVFETVLERGGHAVSAAGSGDEGLRLFHDTPVDLVIVDVLMPEKGGLETIVELQHGFPAVKLIAVSGGFQKRTDRDHVLAGTLGVHRTLAKPFTPEELLRVVQETLDG
ncbi:MAG: response regulator [Verrucomicrobia bacterium]|nr:response regulator [Verrucomicrobiota bacterium]